MTNQPKLKPYSSADAFDENAEARTVPYGTVDRNALQRLAAETTPPKVDADLLARGKQRFEIYCTPCHGLAGLGDGIVVKRGFPQPPSYAEPRLLAAKASHFYDVITHGWGVMYSYAARIDPRDRWAIAAYIRALQVAQTGAPKETASAKIGERGSSGGSGTVPPQATGGAE
ncbi:cytochrome c [Aurantimonas sp. VKM B-3413]|nr:cytochrome c [Aurantimonas sp. VKM B-3413]MCB8839662.1 cytochrome c [Aurantimonas sp. VKM B-3413]